MISKKAVSEVIITTLMVLLVIVIAGMIYLSSSGFLDKMERESAVRLAKEQCPIRFNVELSACYINQAEGTPDEIHLDIINLKEPIPDGSQISLINNYQETLMPITDANIKLMQGESKSFVIETSLELTNYISEKMRLRFIPIFITSNQRVLCNEIPEIDINAC